MRRTWSDEELAQKVEELNGLYPEGYGWQQVRANKEHRDQHGVKIKPWEWYYRLSLGSFDFYPIKYSAISMEHLIDAVLTGNPILEEVSARIRDRRREDLLRCVNG